MDHAGLLQALPFPDQPCGGDLSFSAAFDQIQEARRFDDPTLAQGEWVTDVKEADWRGVIRLCEALLATQTKDLRVAGWLTEALGRAHGLAGLADGHALTAALCDSFWDDIHPQPEDGELEQRIGALDWLLAQTTRLLRDIPLTASPKGRYSLADLEGARAHARNPGAAGDSPRLTLEGFDTRPYPRLAIARAHALLESDGFLHIPILEFDALAWRLLGINQHNQFLQNPARLHMFTRAHLFKVLEEEGFTPDAVFTDARSAIGLHVLARKK